jgi:hypothetical protein
MYQSEGNSPQSTGSTSEPFLARSNIRGSHHYQLQSGEERWSHWRSDEAAIDLIGMLQSELEGLASSEIPDGTPLEPHC